MGDIALTLERIYNTQIIIESESLKEQQITGTLKNNNLESIFNTFMLSCPILYEIVEITVRLHNSRKCAAKEVVQLYVRDVFSSVVTPAHELKGFKKVLVKQGETTEAKFVIPISELALYNKEMSRVVEPGSFDLQVSRASDDIRIKKIITVEQYKEKRIPMTVSKGEKTTAVINKRATPVAVKGVVRDVQANLLPGITISVKNKKVQTDTEGSYTIQALSTNTLIMSAPSI